MDCSFDVEAWENGREGSYAVFICRPHSAQPGFVVGGETLDWLIFVLIMFKTGYGCGYGGNYNTYR